MFIILGIVGRGEGGENMGALTSNINSMVYPKITRNEKI